MIKNSLQNQHFCQISHYTYHKNEVIGNGFSSVVYKGLNRNNNQPVAIKVIDTNNIKTEVQKTLLSNQIRALSQLKHKNIVETYDILQNDNFLFIITQYCNQGDLFNTMNNRGKYTEEQALKLFSQIVEGLAFIISNGIIHRDLKSSNILIKNHILKIADFGFCYFISDNKPQQYYNVGSPLYMSPQAYKKTNYSHKSDIWALGIILYEMLLGYQPFRGIDYDTLIKQITSGQIYKTINVSGFVKMLLSRLLSLDLQRRIDIKQLQKLLSQNNNKILSQTPVKADKSNVDLGMRHTMINLKSGENTISSVNQQFFRNSLGIEKPKLTVQTQTLSSNSIKVPNTMINQFSLKHFPKPQLTHPKLKPLLISFDSNLSINSNLKGGQMTKRSRNLLISKFLYRLSKIIVQLKSRFQNIKKILLLVMKHLNRSIKYFQEQNLFYLAQNHQQTTFSKLKNRVEDMLTKINFKEFQKDIFFTHMINQTKNYNSVEAIYYIQFWLKIAVKQLNQQIQKKIRMTPNFNTPQIHLLYMNYFFIIKYYEILCHLKGKNQSQEIPVNLQVQKIITQSPQINIQGFVGLSNKIRSLVRASS